MEITLCINGQEEHIGESTIKELVCAKGLAAASLVVEHNGRIVKQADWRAVMLKDNDVLELLNFVGGG